jgi:hypothetical protein
MMWLKRLVLGVCLTLPLGSAVMPAQENPPAAEPAYEFFSGNIVQFTDTKMTVARTALGQTENRDFLITPETKVEGKLRNKARVTVGFKSSDQGDVAVRVIVRSSGSAAPKK